MRQRQRDRAPKEAVFALPEAVWVPEEWEKEDDSPAPTTKMSKVVVVAPVAGHAEGGEDGHVEGAANERGAAEEDEEEHRAPFITGMPKQKPQQSSSSTGITTTTTNTTTATTVATVAITKKRKFYSKDECAICLGSFERGDVIRILPCGHLFHKLEVDDWLVKWKKVVSSRFAVCLTDKDREKTWANVVFCSVDDSVPFVECECWPS
ncbi:hypothetical protein QFC22_004932 [Naganishia vaughanmartiniae]|uniref:Uncharacterized protein n=1 Tax=Naganishia vaughanmartiniae TaxID=1424756 RepID=A0ACC2WZC2_9TREE|nr:hypothetical protein QFC22_004932 [Naganishia vaughanmartiniae]